MRGRVVEVKRGAFCFLTGDDGTTYFAHRDAFADQKTMRKGTPVDFQVSRIQRGPKPEAIEIFALKLVPRDSPASSAVCAG